MFNYVICTENELTEHIKLSSAAKISVAKRYHESKGNFEIVAKINKARALLKLQRLSLQCQTLLQEYAQ